jgi:RNA polymerase sigma factor (sigma-70 family)
MNDIDIQFRAILTKFEKRVYLHALRVLGNKQDAEEATQDVFMKIYQGLKDFRGESELSTWIFRLVANDCISRRRGRRWHFVSLDDSVATPLKVEQEPEQEHEITENEPGAFVKKCISLLPAREATAVMLAYYEDKSYGEIAHIMGVSQGTVAVFLHRGRVHLHQLLGRYIRTGQINIGMPGVSVDAEEKMKAHPNAINDAYRETISHLPSREAEAIELSTIEGKSYRDIAAIMGVTVGTAGALLHRGRKHIRKLIGSHVKKEN